MKYPLLYELNGRIWLTELNRKYRESVDLSKIPEYEFKRFRGLKMDYLWLMGVWQTGEKSVAISRTYPELQHEYKYALPDLKTSDITGSPYAIAGYKPGSLFGSFSDLERFHRHLNDRDIKLILDFIPNHMGLDHPWVNAHPEYFLQSPDDTNFDEAIYKQTGYKIVNGKDPYFPNWSDTLQLDYTSTAMRRQQINNLLKLAKVCDGVRCDMAMLVTREVFYKTWKRMPDTDFWPEAISEVKSKFPAFCFIAEVYWDMEWPLQQMGFDYTYDKRLYDRLSFAQADEIHAHLRADADFQNKSIRFIENHDQNRAVTQFGREKSLAAATVIMTLPGMHFLHSGQTKGYRIKIPVQLCRLPNEKEDNEVKLYYKNLIRATGHRIFKTGTWRLQRCQDSRLLYWTWHLGKSVRLVVINYSNQTVETMIDLPADYLIACDIAFKDELTGNVYVYPREHLCASGLYIKLAPFQSHIFSMKSIQP